MDTPTLLPPSLQSLAACGDDDELFEAIRSKLGDLVDFVTYALDDTYWLAGHHLFIKKALALVTRRYSNRQLTLMQAQALAKPLRENYAFLSDFLPKDLTVEYAREEYAVNSILFTVSSTYMRNVVEERCFERQKKDFRLRDEFVTPAFFRVYMDFIEKGLPSLWKEQEETLMEIMRGAVYCQCREIEEFTAEALRPYLNRDNVIERLVQAQHKGWASLEVECLEVLNCSGLGLLSLTSGGEGLALELLDYSEETLSALKRLQEMIVKLACHGDLVGDARLGILLAGMRRLASLDVSGASSCSHLSEVLPDTLAELDLSQIPSLDDEVLAVIFARCPKLKRVHLRDNAQLTHRAWHALTQLRELQSLDLAGCIQIEGGDLKVILMATPQLEELSLAGCSAIAAEAFFELVRYSHRFTHLDLSHTSLDDASLVEVATRCPLISLDISHCPSISERGIANAKRCALHPFLLKNQLTS